MHLYSGLPMHFVSGVDNWINSNAKVIIVGVTPGLQQACESLLSLRSALLSGQSVMEAAQTAKEAASFKGPMRTLGARLMDYFELHKVFRLESTLDLFGESADLAHYTSVLRYPVTKDGKNYSGDARLLERPMLRSMVEEFLYSEIKDLSEAWIVPFGPTAHRVIDFVIGQDAVMKDRILGGILHPGGQQWNRYKVQLGLVSPLDGEKVPGGREVLRRTSELHSKVARILASR